MEAVVGNGLSIASEELIVAQKQIPQQCKREALEIFELGLQQYEQKQYQEALKTFNKVLAICRKIGDKKAEAQILNNIGTIYRYLELYDKAVNYLQQSLAIQKQIGDKRNQVVTLNNIGFIYRKLGKYNKALDSYKQVLAIQQQIGDSKSQYITLKRIGLVYGKLNKYKFSLGYYQKALAISRLIGDKKCEAITLNNIVLVYENLGEYALSLDSFQNSLVIRRSINDKRGEGVTLNNIGLTYYTLGEYNLSLNYFQKALTISRLIGDKNGEGSTLSNIGKIYQNLAKYSQALDFFQQTLAIQKQLGNQKGEATTLNNIGTSYHSSGEYIKALDYYQQALAIDKQLGNIRGEALTLNNIGKAYQNLSKYEKAFDYYQQSLTIKKQFGDKVGIGNTFNNLGALFAAQKQPSLAIVFLKQSVQNYEQIREKLRLLPIEQQKTYTKKVAHTYRRLADLLIQQDRILEAQKVLDLLKVQELEDYLRNVRGSKEKLVVLRPEAEILTKYNQLQTNVIKLGQELTQLRKIPENSRTPTQKQRIAELVKLQADLNKQFNEFSESKEIIALLNKLSRQAQKMAVDLSDLDGLRDDLKRLDAVMLYPLILEDRLELIITTPDSPPLRRTVKVKRTELNQVITQFRQALQNPAYDAKTPAQKLYSWLIKPLENDLKQSQTKTIIYAPDGQLRYIPLSALHDGDKWLVQNFRVNNITAKSLTDFTAKPQPQPRVLAGAFVEGKYNVQVTGRNYPFAGLPYAGKEVENLTKILPKTTKLIDKEFSKDDTIVKMNEYNIVHLATHAAFVPGEASLSFILFGDGETANLKEIGTWTLNNVDLVVLSACETGIGGKFGNGEEVLGLGYQFQNRGVRATVASLWQVDDGGTQVLMDTFYNALKQRKMTKAEALRQAQITLISSNTNLEHPNYWAPFILIGNGL